MAIDVKDSSVQQVVKAGREPEEKAKNGKRKEKARKTVLRVIISLLVIALGIFVLLYVVSRAAHYDSIGSMLQHMWGELTYMWENRLTS